MFLYCKETAIDAEDVCLRENAGGCEDNPERLSFVSQPALRRSPVSTRAARQKSRLVLTLDKAGTNQLSTGPFHSSTSRSTSACASVERWMNSRPTR